MASEANTPTGVSTPGRKGRRSWFTPGKSILLEFAHEQPARKQPPTDEPEEEIETLMLTHFSKPPRIDFGTLRIGKTRTRKLLIQNPHEYEQEVFVEKFPFAKNFSVDLTEFVVDAYDKVILRLTWSPLDAGNSREMILFHVQDTYRLQTIMFGKADEPPKPKKKSLWERAKRPFGVLQTKNRNMQENVDPRRSTFEKRGLPKLPGTPTIKPEGSSKNVRAPRESLRQKQVHVEKENTPPVAGRPMRNAAPPLSPSCLKRTITYTKVTSPRKDRSLKVPTSPPIREEDVEGEEKAGSATYEDDSLMRSPESLQVEDLSTGPNYHIQTNIEDEFIETEVVVVQEMHQQESIVMETHIDVEVIEEEFLFDEVTGEKIKLGETVQRHQFGDRINETNTKVIHTVDVERFSQMCHERDTVGSKLWPTDDQRGNPDSLFEHPVSHQQMMHKLDAVQSKIEEQLVASTPVTSGMRQSFDALTARKLPSPVSAADAASAAKACGYFPSPLDLPDDSNNRVAAIHQWRLNSRKELFSDADTDNLAGSHKDSQTDAFDGTPGQLGQTSGHYFEPITSPEANRRFSTLTVTKSRSDLPHNEEFKSTLHVPKKELFAKPASPDHRRISNVTVTKSSPTLAHLLPSSDDNVFKPIISPDARRISNITVTKSSPEFLKPLSPDARRISNITVTKKEPSFLHLLNSPAEDSIFKEIKSPDARRISNATVTIQSPSMSHLLLSPPIEEECETQPGSDPVSDVVDSAQPKLHSVQVTNTPDRLAPVMSLNRHPVCDVAAYSSSPGVAPLPMTPILESVRPTTRSSSSSNRKTSSQSSRGPGLSPSDLLNSPLAEEEDVFMPPYSSRSAPAAREGTGVSRDVSVCSPATTQLLMTPESEQRTYRIRSGRPGCASGVRAATSSSISMSQLLESPLTGDDNVTDEVPCQVTVGEPSIPVLGSSEKNISNRYDETSAACQSMDVSCNESEAEARKKFLEQAQATFVKYGSPSRLSTIPYITVTPVQQRAPPSQAGCSPERDVDVTNDDLLNGSGSPAPHNQSITGASRKRRSVGKSRDAPCVVYSLKRSSKGKRRHRRSVTQTLDSSICSPEDLPEAETSLRVEPSRILSPDDDAHVQPVRTSSAKHSAISQNTTASSPAQSPPRRSATPAVDDPMERLKKSPAKYSCIFLQAGERNSPAQSPLRKSDLDSKTKRQISPKKRSIGSSKGGKKNSPKNSLAAVKLSRRSPIKVGHSGKSPRRSGGETNKRSSMGKPVRNESFFSRLSQPKHVANATKAAPVKGGRKEMSQSAGPVLADVERPKGFTRTMELRRQAALSGMNKTGKQSLPLKPKTTAPAKKPKLSSSVSSVKGLAKSKLTLIKPKMSQTALPKHPLAFAAKNMYYDERWMEKQERGFVRWLNFVLTPPDEHIEAKTQKVDVGALSMSLHKNTYLAPSKEDLSLRAYTAQRRLNRLRRTACMTFTTESMAKVIRKLETEVEAGRIAVRKDRKLHADLGIKQNLLDMILSYNPLWLRIGLEVIFGEMIFVQSNSDLIGLSRFILTRLLSNPDIAQQFAHPTVPHLYKPGYDGAMAQFILKKFLLLVLFLDLAKQTRLIEHDPCLFCKDANFKASRDLLLTFSRDYLSGEGDLTKHLSYLGYQVKHVQTALEEYDYAVENLAKDLRDGVRLVRVCELLMSDWTLSDEVRVPAISRLQKIHNVDISFRVLAARGVELQTIRGGKIDTRDVVDGHREKTLQMLWRIIFNFQVEMMLNERQLKDEIKMLKNHLHLRAQVAAVIDDNLEALGLPRDRRQSTEPDLYFTSPRLSLLLRWCRAVCAYYDVKVENFTVSFSDGRVLCYLVHHYHPSLLPRDSINSNTTQTFISQDASPNTSTDGDDSFSANWTTTFSPTTGKPGIYDELLANERENFKLLYEKVSELGGIPMMVRSSDLSNTIPDEKVVITYVSYLCMRLLDIRLESRAARLIQAAWRTYWLRKNQGSVQRRHSAAEVIQRAVKSFLLRRREQQILSTIVHLQARCRGYLVRCQLRIRRRQLRVAQENVAATKIQVAVRQFLRRRHEAQIHAACKIQAAWRSVIVRRRFSKARRAVIIVQSHIRRRMAERRYRTQRNAVLLLQRWLRATWSARCERRHYIRSKSAAICIQKNVRMHLCRQRFITMYRAAVRIQSAIRMHQARQTYKRVQSAALILQQRWRSYQLGKRERLCFLHVKAACVILQKHYWLWRTRCIGHQIHAATCIQAAYRGYCARKQMQRERAACTIQAAFRMHCVRREYAVTHQAVVTIQRMFRCVQKRRDYCKLRDAAIVLQRHYRATIVRRQHREQYIQLRASAIVIQSVWRGQVARKQVKQHRAARTIQSAVRCYQACRRYQQMRHSAILIQSTYRCHKQRSSYTALRHATVTLQTYYRAHLLQKQQTRQYQQLRSAAVILQSCFRQYRQRQLYLKMQHAAVIIQAAWRKTAEQKKYIRLRCAAVVIQTVWRKKMVQVRYCRLRSAAVRIQKAWRKRTAQMKYQRLRSAAIVIQATWRKKVAQQEFTHYRKSVVTVQAAWRTKMAVTRYHRLRSAAITVQAAWKRKVTKTRYDELKSAAVTLQAAWRKRLAQTQYNKLKSAAVIIQAAWQRRMEQTRYNQLKLAVITAQAIWRRRLAQTYYNQLRNAAIVIQAAWRRRVTQLKFNQFRHAAVIIQAAWRSRVAYTRYNRLKNGAVVLQQWYRNCCLMRETQASYAKKRRAAVCIQSAWRRHIRRQQYMRIQAATLILQTCIRHTLAQRRFARVKSAATIIQCWYRSLMAARQCRSDYRLMKRSAITIQSAWRGHVKRQQYQQVQTACLVLQSNVRRYLIQKHYRKTLASVVTLQRWLRSVRDGRMQRELYLQHQKSAVVIQRAWRQHMTRKCRHEAACIIQKNVRRHLAHTSYHRMRRSAIIIQSVYRGHVQRRAYTDLCHSVLIIQEHYRAHRLRKQSQCEYQKLRRAAITLQTQFRAWRDRTQYLALRATVVICQSAWRRNVAVRNYQRQRDAAFKIRCWYRNCRVTKQVQKEYCEMRQSAVCIQSAWRGLIERRAYIRQKAAALILQTHIRCFLSRQHYLKLKSSAVTIQHWYRSILAGRSRREIYRQRRWAVITIQSCWRRYVLQQHYQEMRAASIKLQAWVRMHLMQKYFRRIQQSVITIQRWYRASSQGRRQRECFLQQRASAIVLQSTWRAHSQRRSYMKSKRAAIVIQSHVRCVQARRHYQSQLHAARTIQCWFRCVLERQQAIMQHAIETKSAIMIQAITRGYIARQNYQRTLAAVVTIQSYLRMFVWKKHYKALHEAAVIIQHRWRAQLAARHHRNVYIRQRSAASVIAAAWRGHVERVRYLSVRTTVVHLQARVRGHQQRLRYLRMRHAVYVIQRSYRATKQAQEQRCVYVAQKKAAVTIQSVFRSYKARQEYKALGQSCVTIQSVFRGYLVRREVRRQNAAACCIQRWFRQCLVYHIRRGACIVLQSVVRAWLARQYFLKQRTAAVTLQKHYRGHRDRRLVIQRFAAILVLQSHLRAALLARQQRNEYEQLRGAAVCLQSVYRGIRARRDFAHRKQCVIRMQACYRRYIAQKHFHHCRDQIIKIQSLVRMHQCRSHYLRTRSAACTLQRHIRSYQLGCVQRNHYRLLRKVVLKLQARVQAKQTQRSFLIKRNAAIVIQRHVRARRVTKTVKAEYVQTRKSIIVVQSVIRRWSVQRRVQRHRAAMKIQSFFRMIRVVRTVQSWYSAAVRIQSQWRRHVARREAEKRQQAICVLQTYWRCHLRMREVRQDYLAKRRAAVVIQAHCRGRLTRQQVRRLRAVIRIQSAVRSYQHKLRHVVHLQAIVRGWLARRRYSVTRIEHSSAVCIQRAYREYRNRKRTEEHRQQRRLVVRKFVVRAEQHLAVIRCQRIVRRFIFVRRVRHQIHAILTIQRWMRVRLVRLRYLRLCRATRILQAAFREHLARRRHAASRIQVAVRCWLQKRREAHVHVAATRIQALWRGYKTRRAVKDKRLHEARRRCLAAAESATDEKRLGNRTTSALDFLLKYKQLSYILNAVMHLEVSTRLSPRCCERMAEANAVDVIYRLIRSCNRSLPHMEIITYCIAILLNLAKYERTTYAVYIEDSVETLLDLLQIYRGKGGIFTKTCTLIGILGYEPHRRKEIVAIPKLVEKMQSIYNLTRRQHKLEEKRQVTKTKMAAARNLGTSILVGSTPRKQMQRIRPEWVLRRNSVREIVEPMAAITFVLNALQVVPK